MNCNQAFPMILEAEPGELEGAGESALARHVRDCPSCAAMARDVIQKQAALSQALVDEVASPDLDALLDEALGPSEPRIPRHRVRFGRFGLTLLPLAAAAALAALFLGGDPPLPGEPYRPAPQLAGLDLEVPEGRDVAVLSTRNPDITVLWFF